MNDETITCEECGQTFIGVNGLTEWTFHRALRHADLTAMVLPPVVHWAKGKTKRTGNHGRYGKND